MAMKVSIKITAKSIYKKIINWFIGKNSRNNQILVEYNY